MKDLLKRMASGYAGLDDELIFILDALPISLSWASLPDGKILFVNRAFTKTFGYENGSFRSVDRWIDETYTERSDREEAHKRWDHLWNADIKGMTEIPPFELRVKHADGRTVAAIHRGIVLHDIRVAIATFEDISSQKLAENSLRRIAFEDPLTGLGNRRALLERWTAETQGKPSRGQTMMALMMIDLDNFKPVNDDFGHSAGDEILKLVATRLRQSVRHHDTVVRMGGDEFVILLPGLEDRAAAEKLCQRISDAFAKPFVVHGESINVGATVGASLYPHHATDLDSLLRAADHALYRMKGTAKNNWDWFDRSFEQQALPSDIAMA
jgi:diguanylate cyclase (GGDEF)-like protein/PAS domain S-box-containing protein